MKTIHEGTVTAINKILTTQQQGEYKKLLEAEQQRMQERRQQRQGNQSGNANTGQQ